MIVPWLRTWPQLYAMLPKVDLLLLVGLRLDLRVCRADRVQL